MSFRVVIELLPPVFLYCHLSTHHMTDPCHPTLSSFSSLSSLRLFPPHTPQHTTPVPPTGREILEPAFKKQWGGQALPGRPAAEGEPDHGARRLPGAGERRPPAGSGRHEEGARSLQEHHQQVREPARGLVKRRRMKEEGSGEEGELREGYDPRRAAL